MKKKVILIIYVILIILPVFSETIYNSNILGMRLEQIESIDKAKGDYFIMSMDDENETEYLYKKDKLIYKRSLSFEDEKIITIIEKEDSTETITRENGLVLSELIEKPNSESELVKYYYDDNSISIVEYYMNRILLYKDIYYYTKEGRLLDVKRSYDNKEKTDFSICYRDGEIYSYMLKSIDETTYIEFDKYGIILNDVSGIKSAQEKREYGQLSDGRHWILITNKSTGKTLKKIFDVKNRMLQSIEKSSDGFLIEERLWVYQGDLIKSLKIRRKVFFELYTYDYQRNGDLKEVIYYKNGIIMQKTSYQNRDTYIEIMYRYGKPVLKMNYKDGRRISIEDIQE